MIPSRVSAEKKYPADRCVHDYTTVMVTHGDGGKGFMYTLLGWDGRDVWTVRTDGILIRRRSALWFDTCGGMISCDLVNGIVWLGIYLCLRTKIFKQGCQPRARLRF